MQGNRSGVIWEPVGTIPDRRCLCAQWACKPTRRTEHLASDHETTKLSAAVEVATWFGAVKGTSGYLSRTARGY